jgi:hypothetical protein
MAAFMVSWLSNPASVVFKEPWIEPGMRLLSEPPEQDLDRNIEMATNQKAVSIWPVK